MINDKTFLRVEKIFLDSVSIVVAVCLLAYGVYPLIDTPSRPDLEDLVIPFVGLMMICFGRWWWKLVGALWICFTFMNWGELNERQKHDESQLFEEPITLDGMEEVESFLTEKDLNKGQKFRLFWKRMDSTIFINDENIGNHFMFFLEEVDDGYRPKSLIPKLYRLLISPNAGDDIEVGDILEFDDNDGIITPRKVQEKNHSPKEEIEDQEEQEKGSIKTIRRTA